MTATRKIVNVEMTIAELISQIKNEFTARHAENAV